MQWFKHDSNANSDDKLQNILLDYGLEGYGLYWYCIELIVNRVDKDNITFELKHDARVIARNTGSTPQKVEEMMRRFIDLGLFESGNGAITCLKLLKRMDTSMTSNQFMREIISKAKTSHDEVMTQSGFIMQEEKRIEEKREDKSRKEKTYSPPIGSELLADWKKHRGKNGITETVFKGFEREALKAGIPVEEAIRISIERGWRGFNADWLIGSQYKKSKDQEWDDRMDSWLNSNPDGTPKKGTIIDGDSSHER